MTNLSFDVFWRDHGATQGMQKLGTEAKKSHGEVDHFSKLAPHIGEAFGALVGVEVFSEWIHGARKAAAETRITENVIRTTGGAAHVSAADVNELTKSLAEKTGVDDDVIRSGANLLLTFTGVRNEVGKGNDVYNRATADVTDLAAAMNNGAVTTDGVKAASIQLGKALNDPIKGLTALRRIGVSFTEQQQAQIKALVASGHTLEAQKIILGEVEKEFGGTAAAAADPMAKLTVVAEDLGKQIGGALLPAVDDFASFMTNTGAPALSSFVTVLTKIPAPAYAVAAGLAGIVLAARTITKVTGAYREVVEVTGKALDFFAARTTAAAEAEAAQAGAAEGAAAAEGAHAKASGTAAAATTEVAAASEGAAAAETTQAAAADTAAASTGRLGLAAQGAGSMLGALAGKALLAGGIAGLAYLSGQVSGWQGTAEVTTVKTNDLADALLHLSASAHAPKAALDAVTTSGERYWSSVETGTDVMKQFGALAKGAFGDGLQDIIGRAQSGSERMDRFAATASQLDGALTAMVQSGHAKDAAAFLASVKTESGLADDEFVHVTNHLPGYTAAIGGAGTATSETAGAEKDLTRSTQQAKAAADAHAAALKNEIANLTAATDAFLAGRAAARAVKDAQDALTKSIHDNGRGLSDNTAKGRANAAALDDVADKTRKDLQAKLDAGTPMARFTRLVADSRAHLIAEAEAAGMTAAAAKKYADRILAVPRKQITNYQAAHLDEVIGKVGALHRGINSLSSRSLQIALQSAGDLPTRLQIYAALKGRKDGGRITGPGGPRSDTAGLFALSNGEFVVNAAATSRHLGTLTAINAGRMADGGVVGRHVNYTASARGFWPSAATIGGYYGAVEQMMANAIGAKFAATYGSSPAAGVAGVARWAPVILNALRLIHQSSSWLNTVEGRMARESGGDPRAINNWDINAQHGDPSRGLMQVIGGTFRAYHVPGTSWDIYNPLANIAAGLSYAVHRYGTLMALNRPGGYAAGTSSAAPGWHWVGEHGPELVRFRGGERVLSHRMSGAAAGGGVTVNITIDGTAVGLEDRVVGAVRSATRHGRLSRAVLP